MKPKIASALFSMLHSPRRMHGRTWLTELCTRVLRKMFYDGSVHGVDHLRLLMDGAGDSVTPKLKVSITEKEIAGIRCLVTTPKNSTPSCSSILLYFHGGGFVAGSPEGYQNLLSLLSEQSNAVIIAADYRLSPENVFPAAQDDCLAVSKQVLTDYPKHKVILGGDSAGGNLAISTQMALTELAKTNADKRTADGLVLISPWVEPTANSGSIFSNQQNDIFEPEFLHKSYLAHVSDSELFNPRVNFINSDLSLLPRTYMQCGGGEQFVDQIRAFEERAKNSGAEISLDVFDSQFHDFQVLWPLLKEGKNAIFQMAEFVQSV